MIACLCLGGALVLSLQRYFPSRQLSLGRIIIDLGVITLAMNGGLVFTSTGAEEELSLVVKPLIM